MSAYIYKLISPKNYTWMNVQFESNGLAETKKVYHLKFWYKPYSGMEDDKKLQNKLMREEKKTKELFKDTPVKYAILTFGWSKGKEGSISKPFNHGEYFGCYQVINWNKLIRNGEVVDLDDVMLGNCHRICFNDEDFDNIYHKAYLASKEEIVDEVVTYA